MQAARSPRPTDRHRVAYAFDQGAAALYVVDPHDAIHGDDYAAEAIRFAESITAKLSSYGQALEEADRRIAQVVTWMRQQIQIGARYAATNPGRFGTAWDGVPKRSFISGRTYQYPAGTITYDCSGLMVVGFRQIGVDLVKLGASWTGSMLANLPRVPRDQMQVGDLIILGRGGRTTHVVMYLGQDRYIHAGSCGSTMGVCEREGIDWSRVMGVARVPLHAGVSRNWPRPVTRGRQHQMERPVSRSRKWGRAVSTSTSTLSPGTPESQPLRPVGRPWIAQRWAHREEAVQVPSEGVADGVGGAPWAVSRSPIAAGMSRCQSARSRSWRVTSSSPPSRPWPTNRKTHTSP